MNEGFYLSVVTPTYNRGELLKRCFQSLKEQTDKSFEWIVVDDGSTDDTRQVVEGFRKEAPDMPIRYEYKENGGKHTALNASHPFVRGTHVLFLDSDDRLLPHAVETVRRGWERYGDDPTVGMVVFLKGQTEDRPFAYAQEGVPLDVLRHRRITAGSNDCCETIPTELFLKYPYPVFENERFLSEGVLWKQIGQDHSCVYVNRVIYIAEYLDDGLTRSGRAMRIRNPRGGMLNSSMNMNRRCRWKSRIKNGLLYVCYGFFAGLTPAGIVFGEKEYRMMKSVCLLPGYVLYRCWKKRYGA